MLTNISTTDNVRMQNIAYVELNQTIFIHVQCLVQCIKGVALKLVFYENATPRLLSLLFGGSIPVRMCMPACVQEITWLLTDVICCVFSQSQPMEQDQEQSRPPSRQSQRAEVEQSRPTTSSTVVSKQKSKEEELEATPRSQSSVSRSATGESQRQSAMGSRPPTVESMKSRPSTSQSVASRPPTASPTPVLDSRPVTTCSSRPNTTESNKGSVCTPSRPMSDSSSKPGTRQSQGDKTPLRPSSSAEQESRLASVRSGTAQSQMEQVNSRPTSSASSKYSGKNAQTSRPESQRTEISKRTSTTSSIKKQKEGRTEEIEKDLAKNEKVLRDSNLVMGQIDPKELLSTA